MSEKGKRWDGKSRISTEDYKKRYDEIFKKKTQELETDEDITIKMEQFFKNKHD